MPLINYSQNFGVSPQQAHQEAIRWLSIEGAKIKGQDPSYIEASHGSLMKMTSFDPGYKKSIHIRFVPVQGGVNVQINAEPVGTIGDTSSRAIQKYRTRWG